MDAIAYACDRQVRPPVAVKIRRADVERCGDVAVAQAGDAGRLETAIAITQQDGEGVVVLVSDDEVLASVSVEVVDRDRPWASAQGNVLCRAERPVAIAQQYGNGVADARGGAEIGADDVRATVVIKIADRRL